MLDMLESVVSAPGATGRQARVPGYRVGGKTGTAKKLVNGQYGNGHYIASFAGLAPMSAPKIVIAICIDNPLAGKYGGGDVAAPVFAQIAAGALRSLGIAPDMPLQMATQDHDVASSVAMADLPGDGKAAAGEMLW
jgi:cell division protein FtsI (penicillin-binding protein 3)